MLLEELQFSNLVLRLPVFSNNQLFPTPITATSDKRRIQNIKVEIADNLYPFT